MEIPFVPPLPPTKPSSEDCCGRDCAPCVFDLYDQELTLWERECTLLQNPSSSISETLRPALAHDQYTEFIVQNVKTLTHDVIEIIAGPRDSRRNLSNLDLGHHVIVRFQTRLGEYVVRQLTPFDIADRSMTIMIKLKPGGKLSHFAGFLKQGDSLKLRGPCGGMTYRRNRFSKILMLSIGVAIAALIPYIENILSDDDDETEMTLIYGCRSYEDLMLRERLAEWTSFWNFKAEYYFSAESEETLRLKKRYREIATSSRLDANSIQMIAKNFSDAKPMAAFVAGSPEFEHSVATVLRSSFPGEVFRFASLPEEHNSNF